MRNLFVPTFLGVLLAIGLSSAAIAEEDQKEKSGQSVEKYQTGPFGQLEEDQKKAYENSGEEEQTEENGQTDQPNPSQEDRQSGDNGQSNDNTQSGETGQSGETN